MKQHDIEKEERIRHTVRQEMDSKKFEKNLYWWSGFIIISVIVFIWING